MSKITFYIARHGKTMMNTLDRVQGWCDSPLTPEGTEVAQQLGRGLKDIDFRSAYCSDLRRTHQTAKIVLEAAQQKDVTITEYFGFREACFGSYEANLNHILWGQAAEKMGYTSHDDMYIAIQNKETNYGKVLDTVKEMDTMNMAESFIQVEARSQNALKEIAEKESQIGEGNILVVAHGMSILCLLWNLGGEKLFKNHLLNASVSKVTYQNGEFTVHSLGDMSYVERGK